MFNRPHSQNFYPRSPCGERLPINVMSVSAVQISIHALLAESDTARPPTDGLFFLFLSTLSLRRATVGQKRFRQKLAISIHALLAESDSPIDVLAVSAVPFLSTLSLRRATRFRASLSAVLTISIHALLAESDGFGLARMAPHAYFYPRSPCGERPIMTITTCIASKFLSTLSLRRATVSFSA